MERLTFVHQAEELHLPGDLGLRVHRADADAESLVAEGVGELGVKGAVHHEDGGAQEVGAEPPEVAPADHEEAAVRGAAAGALPQRGDEQHVRAGLSGRILDGAAVAEAANGVRCEVVPRNEAQHDLHDLLVAGGQPGGGHGGAMAGMRAD